MPFHQATLLPSIMLPLPHILGTHVLNLTLKTRCYQFELLELGQHYWQPYLKPCSPAFLPALSDAPSVLSTTYTSLRYFHHAKSFGINPIHGLPRDLQGGLIPPTPFLTLCPILYTHSAQLNQSPCKYMNATSFLIRSRLGTGTSNLESSHPLSSHPSPNCYTLPVPKPPPLFIFRTNF